MKPEPVGVTGIVAMYVPPGEHRELLLREVRHGEKFRQSGRHCGFLRGRVNEHVQAFGLGCSFESLLMALEGEAARYDKGYSSIENVIRRGSDCDSYVIYYERGERKEAGFSHLRNQLSKERKIFKSSHSCESVTHEQGS